MSDFEINLRKAEGGSSDIDCITKNMQSVIEGLEDVGIKVKRGASLNQVSIKLGRIAKETEEEKRKLVSLREKLNEAILLYKETEEQIKLDVKKVSDLMKESGSSGSGTASGNSFWKTFWSEYGVSALLAGSRYINDIYKLVKGIKNGKSWSDMYKSGKDIKNFLSKAAKEYNNYKKIGNAVGTKKAMTWWAKSITGFKPLGRASTAKSPLTRFIKNLTNKTSPFNAQFKNIVDNFKGANGIGKAVSSWGSVAMTGVMNWFDNKEEQKASGGTMSDGRVWAETITETAVDTALTYGASIVVGAAVTTAFGTVAAPGIVVVAASGAVVAGINAGVKVLTGKTTTEWVSDTILDTVEVIGNFGKSVGSWFNELSFT